MCGDGESGRGQLSCDEVGGQIGRGFKTRFLSNKYIRRAIHAKIQTYLVLGLKLLDLFELLIPHRLGLGVHSLVRRCS